MYSRTVTIVIFLGMMLFAGCAIKPQSTASPILDINYAAHIHPIIRRHCMPCHQPGQAAPFTLLGYEDVRRRSKFILHVVENRIMPPWPADPTYRSFMNERILTDKEIMLIEEWIATGMEPGDTSRLESFVPANLYQRKEPDHVFSMPFRFNIEPKGADQFARFRVSSDLKEDIDVAGFEFVPGNLRAVHHTELLVSSSRTGGLNYVRDSIDVFVSNSYTSKQAKVFRGFEYVTGWLPGTTMESFPIGVAKKMEYNADYIFLIHYPPLPVEEEDSSVLYIYETKENVERYMLTVDLHGTTDIVNGPLVIPANTVKTFHEVDTVEQDVSAFAIMPHAHHLCKKMIAYGVTPSNDTIPLLRINDWHFGWQFLYKFPHYIKLPQGTVINFYATYDNTDKNPENPNNPPQDVHSSFNADDEMMELFIFGVPYRDGDENLLIEYQVDNY